MAGVAACLQGAAIEALGAPLTPGQVRAILSNPANGTLQADSLLYPAANFPIGPLPDMPRVLRAAGISPDVYMRDNVADTGTEPYVGATLCWSPDVIVKLAPVANPQAAFGVATWGDANLGDTVELGQDNYVYARMHNRGNAPDDVTIDLYWTIASGFLHPATWNHLGTLIEAGIDPGEHRVSGPVVWPQADVPALGHYCLIGVVNSVRDPVSIPGAFSSVTDYLDFVRNHNNICYRNMNVVDAVPGGPPVAASFVLRGLPRRAAKFRLEVRHRLPQGVKLKVRIQTPIPRFERFEPVKKGKSTRTDLRRLAPRTEFAIREYRPLIVPDIPVRRAAAVPVEVKVAVPRKTRPGEYLLHADQFLGTRHLGRVNVLLRVGKPKRRG